MNIYDLVVWGMGLIMSGMSLLNYRSCDFLWWHFIISTLGMVGLLLGGYMLGIAKTKNN